MGIARFTASADNTITNAFKSDLSTRATGSNMGLSDILETFVIYGQAESSSVEKSRILIEFPMGPISSSRVSGSLPDSGSVSFYLRMFNAEHGSTLPRDYMLEIRPVKIGWQEGMASIWTTIRMKRMMEQDLIGLTVVLRQMARRRSNGQQRVEIIGAWTMFHRRFQHHSRSGDEGLELDITPLVEQWMQDVTGSTGKD